jgi:hypothetical protein
MFCSYNTQGSFVCKKILDNVDTLSNKSSCGCSHNESKNINSSNYIIEKYVIPTFPPPPKYTPTPTPTPTLNK